MKNEEAPVADRAKNSSVVDGAKDLPMADRGKDFNETSRIGIEDKLKIYQKELDDRNNLMKEEIKKSYEVDETSRTLKLVNDGGDFLNNIPVFKRTEFSELLKLAGHGVIDAQFKLACFYLNISRKRNFSVLNKEDSEEEKLTKELLEQQISNNLCQQAREWFNLLVEYSSHPGAWYQLGRLNESNPDSYFEARRCYDKAISLSDPDVTLDASNALGEVCEQMNDPENAVKYYIQAKQHGGALLH